MATVAAPKAKVEITDIWNDGSLVKVETPRLTLRPIEEGDLPAYKGIFNETAMRQYRGSFTEARFQTWLTRWKFHNFSALAIVDKTTGKSETIGHAIFGHGDYEGSKKKGWSEISFILHQSYWNKDYTIEGDDIGSKGVTGIGTEAVEALMHLAKRIFEKKLRVPCDLTHEQLEEVRGESVYLEDDKPRAVYLPLTEVRATCSNSNTAALRILRQAFKVSDGYGKEVEVEGDRPGRLFTIETNKL